MKKPTDYLTVDHDRIFTEQYDPTFNWWLTQLSQVPMASPPRPVLCTTKRFGIASIDSKGKDINYEINSYINPAQDAQGWWPSWHQAVDEIGRDPSVEKLHPAALQFLQRNTADQTAQQRTNPTVEGCLRVHGQWYGSILVIKQYIYSTLLHTLFHTFN